ncbi:MAG: hypothetical protein ACK5Z6_03010, partial [Hyphomonadaceae bacterium]
AFSLSINVRFRPSAPPNQTSRFREGFRMLLGVRRCPENESLLLWAVAMEIPLGGVVCWRPLESADVENCRSKADGFY